MSIYDHNGTYPRSAELLKNEAVEQNEWKPFKTPYTHTYGYGLSFEDMSKWKKSELHKRQSAGYFWGLRVRWQETELADKTKPVTPGLVLYEYIKPTHYRIYGLDGKGSVIKDRDRKFYLSNE